MILPCVWWTRPEKKRLGSDESWVYAENALSQALREANLKFEDRPGRGCVLWPKSRIPFTRSLRPVDVAMRDLAA